MKYKFLSPRSLGPYNFNLWWIRSYMFVWSYEITDLEEEFYYTYLLPFLKYKSLYRDLDLDINNHMNRSEIIIMWNDYCGKLNFSKLNKKHSVEDNDE